MAKLAGLPSSVLARAGELLAAFEGDRQEPTPQKRGRPRRAATHQLHLFGGGPAPSVAPLAMPQSTLPPAQKGVVDRLQALDVNRMSPLEALALLAELKGQLLG